MDEMFNINRILRIAENSGEEVVKYLDNYLKAHFVPNENSNTPDFFKKNLDYHEYEDSPYFGSASEFLQKYPGGIRDWLKERREKNEKKGRNKK